jgi:signal transduction histidine kinase
MEKTGEKGSGKAKENAPAHTERKNGIGAGNRTARAPKKRFLWNTLIAVAIVLLIIALTMFLAGRES